MSENVVVPVEEIGARGKDQLIRTDRIAPLRRPLVILNAVLLVILGLVSLAPDADAQQRPRGRYLMTSGGVNGSESDAIYVVDTVNQQFISLVWDQTAGQLRGVGGRNLLSDSQNLLSPGGGR